MNKGLNGWQALGFRSYEDYLKSDMWKNKSKFIKKAKGNCCGDCNSKYSLEVHHMNYDSVGNENGEDVEVLCKYCHRKKHGIN